MARKTFSYPQHCCDKSFWFRGFNDITLSLSSEYFRPGFSNVAFAVSSRYLRCWYFRVIPVAKKRKSAQDYKTWQNYEAICGKGSGEGERGKSRTSTSDSLDFLSCHLLLFNFADQGCAAVSFPRGQYCLTLLNPRPSLQIDRTNSIETLRNTAKPPSCRRLTD